MLPITKQGQLPKISQFSVFFGGWPFICLYPIRSLSIDVILTVPETIFVCVFLQHQSLIFNWQRLACTQVLLTETAIERCYLFRVWFCFHISSCPEAAASGIKPNRIHPQYITARLESPELFHSFQTSYELLSRHTFSNLLFSFKRFSDSGHTSLIIGDNCSFFWLQDFSRFLILTPICKYCKFRYFGGHCPSDLNWLAVWRQPFSCKSKRSTGSPFQRQTRGYLRVFRIIAPYTVTAMIIIAKKRRRLFYYNYQVIYIFLLCIKYLLSCILNI